MPRIRLRRTLHRHRCVPAVRTRISQSNLVWHPEDNGVVCPIPPHVTFPNEASGISRTEHSPDYEQGDHRIDPQLGTDGFVFCSLTAELAVVNLHEHLDEPTCWHIRR